MTDKELDAAIAERFRAYEDGVRLPDGFKGRFVRSLRRKRTLRRVWLPGLICVTAIACVVIVHFTRHVAAPCNEKPVLMSNAAAPANETSEVSCWMLLGYLRECFSRSRPVRRKEDE